MANIKEKLMGIIDPHRKGFTRTLTFKVLIGLGVILLLAVVYRLFVGSTANRKVSEEEEEAEVVRKAERDTIDVVGDYLWPGFKDTQAEAPKEDDKKKDDKPQPIEHAKAAPEAEAATPEDIEAVTGLSPTPTEETNLTATKNPVIVPKEEKMGAPKVEAIE